MLYIKNFLGTQKEGLPKQATILLPMHSGKQRLGSQSELGTEQVARRAYIVGRSSKMFPNMT